MLSILHIWTFCVDILNSEYVNKVSEVVKALRHRTAVPNCLTTFNSPLPLDNVEDPEGEIHFRTKRYKDSRIVKEMTFDHDLY